MTLTGDKVKTTVYTFIFWWESEGTNKDTKLGNSVGTWIAQNEKVLNKKRADEALKLLAEQFPWLKTAEAQHSQLMWGKWVA